MMKKFIFILTVVLIVQIAFSVKLFQADSNTENKKQLAWFTVTKQKVDRLDISLSTGETLQLLQIDGKWVIPEQFAYPVSLTRLDALFNKLSLIKTSWPVATTEAAAKRFKLEEGNYERKLTFYSNGQEVENFYIGSSPGFRKVHVRKTNDNNIYAVNLNAHDAPVKVSDWFDYEITKLDKEKLSSIELADFQLTLQDGVWQANGLTESEQLDPDALDQWLIQITGMRFDSLVDAAAMPEQAKEIVTLIADGKEVVFKLGQEESGSKQILKRSDLPYYFSLQVQQASPLVTIERDQLIRVEEELQETVESPAPITFGEDEESIKQLREMIDAQMP